MALVAVTAMRVWLAQDLPLWLDETWTAMITGQSSWSGFWREAWLDCNAPFYYLVMWAWEAVAGQSNLALRLPSIAFVTAAGVLPLFWRPNAMSRQTALTWSALICLWWPGIAASLDARAYGLLLLISTAQAIAFAQVLERPDLRRAALWAALASLSILTHYYAIVVAAVQGLMLLGLRRPWKTWPAALLFLPAFGWLAVHLPRLTDYAAADVAWYEPITIADIGRYVMYVIGPWWRWFTPAVAAIVAIAALRSRPQPSPLWAVAASGVVALTILLAIGTLQPSLTPRYVTPIAPLALLGLALAVRRSAMASLALIGLFLVCVLTPQAHAQRLEQRAAYGYERQSDWLMKAKPDQVVFLWDHPASKVLDPESLAQIGGFFFQRSGLDVRTTALIVAPGEDPNFRLQKAAEGKRPVFIWLFNTERKSAARQHPPRAQPGYDCRLTRHGPMGVAACAPEGLRD